MQSNRLFDIIYILLDKKTTTGKELSNHFEVSIRTIYRDIDTLSAAGIPIYTNKGKGGGISLIDDSIPDKSSLSEYEKNEILMNLQSLNTVKPSDIQPVLANLSFLFNKQNIDWIDVDFSTLGSVDSDAQKFIVLKTSILNRTIITFDYLSSNGEKTEKTVEPVQLIFKEQSWYLYGFCNSKNDFKLFKITHIKNLTSLTETFKREVPTNIKANFKDHNTALVPVILKINSKMTHRVYDEFDQALILKNSSGNFIVNVNLPEEEWVYSYILSYGNYAEVVSPKHIRKIIKRKFKDGLKKYL